MYLLPMFSIIDDILKDVRIWLIVPSAAIMAWVLAQYYMRKIFVRVAYHRGGNTVEILQCFEKQDKVSFETVKDPTIGKKETIVVTKDGLPELQVAGLKTFKLWHVVENYNKTVDVREVAKANPSKTGSPASTAFSAMSIAFELMAKTAQSQKTQWLIAIVLGIVMFLSGLGWGHFL